MSRFQIFHFSFSLSNSKFLFSTWIVNSFSGLVQTLYWAMGHKFNIPGLICCVGRVVTLIIMLCEKKNSVALIFEHVLYVFQGYVGFFHSGDYFKTIKHDSFIPNPVSELIVQNNLMTTHCMTVIQTPLI